MNKKKHGFLLFFVALMLNLVFVSRMTVTVKAEVNVPVKSIDGKIVLETGKSAVTDGKYIYYAYQGDGTRMDIIRLNPKTLKSKSIVKHTGNGFKDLAINGDYIYAVYDKANGYGIGNEIPYIYRFSKDGRKKEKLAEGKGLIVTDDKLYYFSGKIVNANDESMPDLLDFESDGYISSMDFDGGNREKLVEINPEAKVWFKLFKSGNKIYYMDDNNNKTIKDLEGNKVKLKDTVNAGEFNFNGLFTDCFYDLKTDKKYRKINAYNGSKLQAGTYTSGKWKYKTLGKYSYISSLEVFDRYMMIKAIVNETPESDFYKVFLLSKKGKKLKELQKWIPMDD